MVSLITGRYGRACASSRTKAMQNSAEMRLSLIDYHFKKKKPTNHHAKRPVK
jgi:hypothetical protein